MSSKQLATFIIKCRDCGWDKFEILEKKDSIKVQTIHAICDRCGLGLDVNLANREINFSYEERVTDKK